jgi:hypothetical protein
MTFIFTTHLPGAYLKLSLPSPTYAQLRPHRTKSAEVIALNLSLLRHSPIVMMSGQLDGLDQEGQDESKSL